MQLTPLEAWIGRKIGASDGQLRRADLEAYQLKKLRQTIQLARQKSRFYRRRLANHANGISCLEDLADFPFTTPDDLRREGLQLLCVSQSDIQRVVTLDTSGTSGPPKRIYFTRADQELTIDFFQHGMSTFTRSGDRVLILLPCARPGSVGDLLANGLERLGAATVRHGPVFEPADALKKLDDQETSVLVGAPVNVLTLARFWQAQNKPGRFCPSQALLSTDHVPRSVAAALEDIWGCTVYNHYGMTEMGLGGGVQCQARAGYHLREADLFFEIVDPQTGQPQGDGELGEIVFTTLTRAAMPLIRYRTGDLGRFLPGVCPCGTSLRTLDIIRQRLEGQIALGDAKLGMSDLDEALFPLLQLLNFSASLVRKNGQDQLELAVVRLTGARDDFAEQVRQELVSVPAVRNALLSGQLEVTVRIEDFEPARAGSLAKRVLRDLRDQNGPKSAAS